MSGATESSPQQRVPALAEAIIRKSGFRRQKYQDERLLRVVGYAMLEAGIGCTILDRDITFPRDNESSGDKVPALLMDGVLFDLRGVLGWVEIMQSYRNLNRHWIDEWEMGKIQELKCKPGEVRDELRAIVKECLAVHEAKMLSRQTPRNSPVIARPRF